MAENGIESPHQVMPPATRPEHSEAYWQAMKYVILGLGILMFVALMLAVVVVLRVLPWS